MALQRRGQRVAAAPVLGTKLGQMLVERAVLEQSATTQLREVLRMQVGALLDDRQLFDNRLRREQISKAQPGASTFEKPLIDHHRLRVQRMERRRRRRRREWSPRSCRPR